MIKINIRTKEQMDSMCLQMWDPEDTTLVTKYSGSKQITSIFLIDSVLKKSVFKNVDVIKYRILKNCVRLKKTNKT